MFFDRRSIWFPWIPSLIARIAILDRYSIRLDQRLHAVTRSGLQRSLPYQTPRNSV